LETTFQAIDWWWWWNCLFYRVLKN